MSRQNAFQRACRARPLSTFLLLVAAISGGMFALALVIPGAESPEGFPGFVVWLPMVWSPNIAALLVAQGRGELRALLTRLVPRQIPRLVWALSLAPLAVAALVAAVVVAAGRSAHWDNLGPVVLLLLFAINLPLGPLGEELGWRGFFQPRLDARLGAGRAALLVGGIWALWHLPLWMIDSPQSEIPFLLFSAHVLCYSFTLSALVRRASGGLLPAVVFHFLVNVVTGIVAIAELADPPTWFAWSSPGYVVVAAWSWRALALSNKRGRAWLRSAASVALAAAAGTTVAWAFARPYVPAVRDQSGRPIRGHIATIERPLIGGVEQAVVLRGRSESLPVVLFVHGGPGTPETPMLLDFVPGLSRYVLLAAWEQRGAGKSFSRHVPIESLTIEQMTRDLHEVTDWLLERFDRQRVVLMAHSWGTVIAMRALAERPERYAAYVGIGQVANPAASEHAIYEWVHAEATRRGDRAALRDLEEIGPPHDGDYRDGYRSRARLGQWITRYGGAIAGRSDLLPYVRAVLTTPVYSPRERIDYLRGERFTLSHLWDQMQAFDVPSEVPNIDVPAFFIHGIHDRQTPLEAARAYYESLTAPHKVLLLFEQSAHSPIFEEPERFLEVLQNDVLPLAQSEVQPGTGRPARLLGLQSERVAQ